jgi:3-methyladenine DNA glycosylase/8-oxoguanine DNA glycosylase
VVQTVEPAQLAHSVRRSITPTAPFHFDGTVCNPSHFPTANQRWEPHRFWQTLRWGEQTYGVRLVDTGTVERPSVEATVLAQAIPSPETVDSIVGELAWRFDLGSAAVPAFVAQFASDPLVGPAIRRRPGLRPASAYALYEYLVVTVVLQNTVVRRSAAMLQALFEAHGQLVAFDGQTLWSFWPPAAVAAAGETALRALKLGYRAKTLKRQAQQFVSGAVDEQALRQEPDAGVLVARLGAIYGVGPQSAAYLLGECFHRYDRYDYVPPWEAKVFGRLLGRPRATPDDIRDFLRERYRSAPPLAAHYLWTDLFWRYRTEPVPWLAELIRL